MTLKNIRCHHFVRYEGAMTMIGISVVGMLSEKLQRRALTCLITLQLWWCSSVFNVCISNVNRCIIVLDFCSSFKLGFTGFCLQEVKVWSLSSQINKLDSLPLKLLCIQSTHRLKVLHGFKRFLSKCQRWCLRICSVYYDIWSTYVRTSKCRLSPLTIA